MMLDAEPGADLAGGRELPPMALTIVYGEGADLVTLTDEMVEKNG
jgi:hypothetical protein